MTVLNFAQVEDLWTKNGGNPAAAPIMAAIAYAENGGVPRTDSHNPNPPDDSWGLWQINYYGALGPSRTTRYGSPAQLVADPNLQAKAAIAISGNGTNLQPWTTFTSGAYKRYLNANAIPPLPNVAISPTGPTIETAGQGETYSEGDIVLNFGIAHQSIPRALLRRMAGGAVMAGAVVIGGAGLFLLLGRKAPGPAQVVQQVISARTARATAQTRQEGLLQRQQEREQSRRRTESERSSSAFDSEEPF